MPRQLSRWDVLTCSSDIACSEARAGNRAREGPCGIGRNLPKKTEDASSSLEALVALS